MKLALFLTILAITLEIAVSYSQRPRTIADLKASACREACTEEEKKEHFVCTKEGGMFTSRCYFKCNQNGYEETECTPGSWAHCMNQCTPEERKEKGKDWADWYCDENGLRHMSVCRIKCRDNDYNTGGEVVPCKQQTNQQKYKKP